MEPSLLHPVKYDPLDRILMISLEGVKPGDFDEIVDPHMINLSLSYVKQYEENPRNFINCFIKFQSVRMACAFIRNAYERSGALAECRKLGDFSEYSKRVDERWQKVLADILVIIYSVKV